MPAPGICEGAILIRLGLILGLGAPRFLCDLLFTTGVRGGLADSAVAFALAALMRACAVVLLVLCLLEADVAARWILLFAVVVVGVGVSMFMAVGVEGALATRFLVVVGESGLPVLVLLCALSSRGWLGMMSVLSLEYESRFSQLLSLLLNTAASACSQVGTRLLAITCT